MTKKDASTPAKTRPEAAQDHGESRKPRPTREADVGQRPRSQRQAPAPRPRPAPFVDVATELDDDRKPTIHTGGNVLIKDATILTVTQGTIAQGSILVENGKIKAVGDGRRRPRRA